MESIEFFHIRNFHGCCKDIMSAKGGYTFCLIKSDEGFTWGVSRCSKKDNYCKGIGRQISQARALNYKSCFHTLAVGQETTLSFVHELASLLAKERSYIPTVAMISSALYEAKLVTALTEKILD